MSHITSETASSQYIAAANQLQFAYAFLVTDEDHLVVYVDNVQKTRGLDFTVTGTGNASGGTVSFNPVDPNNGTQYGPSADQVVTLYREMPITRLSDFQANGDFRAETLNDEFDSMTLLLQQQNEILTNNTIRFSRWHAANPGQIEVSATDRAGKALIFDDNGDPIVSTDNYEEQLENVSEQATNAATSATTATTAAGVATLKAGEASNSAATATTAAGLAGQAAASVTSVAADAATATAKAAQAAASASDALEHKDDANEYKNTAFTYKEAASVSASNAQSHATNASNKVSQITGLSAVAQTLEPGASATASYNSGTGVMTLGVPKGDDPHIQSDVNANTSTTTLNLAQGQNFKVTLSSNTLVQLSNLSGREGASGTLIIKQDATGGRTFSLTSAMKTPNGASIAQTTTANSISILTYYVVDSSTILINYIGGFA